MDGPPAPRGLPRGGPSHFHAGNGRAFRSLTARGGGFVLDQNRQNEPDRTARLDGDRAPERTTRVDHFAAGFRSRNPWFLSQVSQSLGQALKEGSGGTLNCAMPSPRPRPWGPRSKRCSSTGTPALRKASAKRRLFSAGTPLSAFVWARNVGGVSLVTCRSFERLSTRSRAGFSPRRFLSDPG